MKLIPLTRGLSAIVDDDDYEKLIQFKWHVVKGGRSWYAMRRSLAKEGFKRGKAIRMHTQVLNLQAGISADHINHNGLDNRKENLRCANKSQNAINWARTHGRYSQGVTFRPTHPNPWCARIQIAGKRKHIGYFQTEVAAAAAAYKEQANILHGQYQAT